MTAIAPVQLERRITAERGKFDKERVLKHGTAASMSGIRCMGRKRREWFHDRGRGGCPDATHQYCKCGSSSLHTLMLGEFDRRGIYVDLGCGDSADAWVAQSIGFASFGVDLAPPSRSVKTPELRQAEPTFFRADMTREIPIYSGTVGYASCHAVIDLMRPEERESFYREVLRVLEPGSMFAFTIVRLVQGFGFSLGEEIRRMVAVGFNYECEMRGRAVWKPCENDN